MHLKRFCKRTGNALLRLHGYVGWSKFLLSKYMYNNDSFSYHGWFMSDAHSFFLQCFVSKSLYLFLFSFYYQFHCQGEVKCLDHVNPKCWDRQAKWTVKIRRHRIVVEILEFTVNFNMISSRHWMKKKNNILDKHNYTFSFSIPIILALKQGFLFMPFQVIWATLREYAHYGKCPKFQTPYFLTKNIYANSWRSSLIRVYTVLYSTKYFKK